MGLFYNSPQPTQATPHAPASGSGGSPPPGIARQFANLAAVMALAWTPAPPQPQRIIPTVPGPPQGSVIVSNAPQSAAYQQSVRPAWLADRWDAQGAPRTPQGFIAAVPGSQSALGAELRSIWPGDAWRSQSAPRAPIPAQGDPPPPTSSANLLILVTYPQVTWNAPALPPVAAIPPQGSPPLPSSQAQLDVVLGIPQVTWSAQGAPPNAAWNVPAPVTFVPASTVALQSAIRSSWPQDQWASQEEPGLVQPSSGSPPPQTTQAQFDLILSIPQPTWDAQAEPATPIQLGGDQPAPNGVADLYANLLQWQPASWAAQSPAPVAGLVAPPFVPPVLAAIFGGEARSIWAQQPGIYYGQVYQIQLAPNTPVPSPQPPFTGLPQHLWTAWTTTDQWYPAEPYFGLIPLTLGGAPVTGPVRDPLWIPKWVTKKVVGKPSRVNTGGPIRRIPGRFDIFRKKPGVAPATERALTAAQHESLVKALKRGAFDKEDAEALTMLAALEADAVELALADAIEVIAAEVADIAKDLT